MNSYHFRGYTVHVHEALKVFIGNDEMDFIIYSEEQEHAVMAILRWLPDNQVLHIINKWRLTFEHDCEKQITIHFDPTFRY